MSALIIYRSGAKCLNGWAFKQPAVPDAVCSSLTNGHQSFAQCTSNKPQWQANEHYRCSEEQICFRDLFLQNENVLNANQQPHRN